MPDGRKFRYDEAGWQTYKLIGPLIHSKTIDESLKSIIAKGEIKFTVKNYHDTTYELWFDTTYSNKIITDSIKHIDNIKITRQ